MENQTCLTILGGLISGLVGVGLFFLQRFRAARDEQENLRFRVYQLMLTPPREVRIRDVVAFEDYVAANERWFTEIKSLALLIRDKELATEIYLFNQKSEEERNHLLSKIGGLINPKLIKGIEEKPTV